MRVPLRASATALILLLITVSLLVGLIATLREPTPMFAVSVEPQCPSRGSWNYYLPNAFMDRLPVWDEADRTLIVRFWSGILRSNPPVWCGSDRDEVYRLIAAGYPKSFVVTISHKPAGWAVEAHEQWREKRDGVPQEQWIERRVLSVDVRRIVGVIDDEGFWWLRHFEEETNSCCYDGPNYTIEARVNGQYHFVTRALERKRLVKAARALAGAAGFDLKPWDE